MGLVDLKELRANIRKADFRGKSAYCFINKDKIIKVYATKQDGDYIPIEPSKICDLSMYESDTIVFPDKYIYEDGKKAGEILKYIKDKSVDETFDDDTNINSVITSYEKVIDDLLIYLNLDMVDLCQVNILYSNENGFHIIDTTEWVMTNSLVNDNYNKFNSSLIRVLVDYLEIPIIFSRYYNQIDEKYCEAIKKNGVSGMKLNNSFMSLMNRHYDFLELLCSYANASKEYFGKDVETFKEMKEFAKVLKKG